MKLSQRLLPYGCAIALVSLLASFAAAAQISAPVADGVTQIPDGNGRVTLKGNVHPLARAEYDRGAVTDSLPMQRILLLLKRSDAQEAALQSFMDAQQDKSSANYHVWLTPDEFGKQYGPSDANVQAVTDWLSAQGFQNVRVAAGRNVIEFSGSAGQVRQAFTTQIQNYVVNGVMYVANASDPQIPAALAPLVAGVVSLHNFPKKSHALHRGDVQIDAASHKLQPLFTFPFGNGTFYGVGPGDFATIYNTKPLIAGGNDGTGQTIAIVGETQINAQDVSDFRAMFGLTNNFSASNIILNGMDPGITSTAEESEADLDVQWSGAVAPGATVKFVVSASTPASTGIDLSALYIIEHNLADVMSVSYGDCEANLTAAGNAFYNTLWEQAAAQGITVVVSSGDGGSAGCDDFNSQMLATKGLAVSGLSGTPFNVSVGGTDFNQFNLQDTFWNSTNDSVTGTSAKGYIPEYPWNENCSQLGLTGCGSTAPQGSVNIIAGSGGTSSVYAKPKWQMGVTGVPNDNHRDQPDVSLFASPGFEGSGYLFCQADLTGVSSCNLNQAAYTFHIIGGTSASAPAFAGMMALVNQYAAAHGGTSRQGNANTTLYALAKKSGASCTSSATEAAGCVFNDVVAGNVQYPAGAASNSVACQGGTINCSATVTTSNGVLVDPAHSTTEAWTVGAGYDRATGLGTLNANNLAAAWTSASTIATTTTLALSPTTGITHGTNENVSVTVNVKPNTGTGVASGDVALLATLADGSTLGVDQFTLANGAVSAVKTQNLPGGTYNVYAHYTGDGTNAPSDSTAVQVTVGKEASQVFIVVPMFDPQTGTLLNGNATSVQYGSPYIIRIYVANSAAVGSNTGSPSSPCYTTNEITCPTGSVALSANSTAIDGGNFTLNNVGYTRDIAPTLTGGTYPLVATYSGDNSYMASTSAMDTVTITPAATSMPAPYIPLYPSLVGTPVNISVYLNTSVFSGVAPTGAIAFYDGTTLMPGSVTYTSRPGQSGTLSATITGAITTAFSSNGTHAVTAQYSGDANYAAATSDALSATVLWPTTTALNASAANINLGQSITVTAQVSTSGKNPAMAGSIQFYASYTAISGSVTSTLTTDASGNQILTATITTTPMNGEFIQATYSGDSNYVRSSQQVFINVNIPDFTLPQNTTISVVAGQSQTAIINVTPLSSMPSTVTFVSSSLPSGMSLTFNPATVSLAGAAVPVTLTLSTTGPSGGPVAAVKRGLRAAVVPISRRTWWSGTFASCILLWCVLWMPRRRLKNCVALFSAASLVIAVALGCGGGSSGNGGGGGGGNMPVPTTITLTTSNAKVAAGGSFTLTAAITSSRTITGTVNIFQGTPPDGNGVAPPFPVVNGQASAMVTVPSGPGIYPFWANYSGDVNNLASQSTATVQQVISGSTSASYAAQTGGLSHQSTITINLQ